MILYDFNSVYCWNFVLFSKFPTSGETPLNNGVSAVAIKNAISLLLGSYSSKRWLENQPGPELNFGRCFQKKAVHKRHWIEKGQASNNCQTILTDGCKKMWPWGNGGRHLLWSQSRSITKPTRVWKIIYPNYWFIKNLTEITLVETTLASDHNSTALTHFTTRKAVRSLETAKQSIILQNFTHCSFRNLFLTANKTCQHFWIQVGKFYYCFSSFAELKFTQSMKQIHHM